MTAPILTDKAFSLFQQMIYDIAGINMSNAKKPLVSGRLAKRVKHHNLSSYEHYFNLLRTSNSSELQIAIDLLTTNETFFFREPKHFDFLRDKVLPHWQGEERRIWSAASSSGEEAYTIAMILAEHAQTDNWEIIGTDISSRVVERARTGLYAIERAEKIPHSYLSRYCLKGTGSHDGTFIIDKRLRDKINFLHANLKEDLTNLGYFDVIFLRNVLIYFDMETKRYVVSRLLKQLKPGGYIVIGHSESLNGVTNELKTVVPSVYQKV